MAKEKIIKFPDKINGSAYFKQFPIDMLKVVFLAASVCAILSPLCGISPFNSIFVAILGAYIAARFYLANSSGEYRRSYFKHALLQRGVPFISMFYKKAFSAIAEKGIPEGFFVDIGETIFRD
ncbi:hypothetical protein CQA57_07100 [Helicobacter anseris]|uniref:Uncharacterized protein n=1 Tax=Helicobacter anseris TaxID=375926 RepID=A0A3D8J4I0_9HELI|nr:hypothetical protein [Helicobacter anseris]RDU72363.1 hypothetical protein CQA57_07100 [Helicobacter anseris]